jgi:hypothetical protein
MRFTFNTGRQYQPAGHPFAGQVIEVELIQANVIQFRDKSRGLDGAFHCVHVGMSQPQIQTVVMDCYDHNRHTSIDFFEHLEREAAKLHAPEEGEIEPLTDTDAFYERSEQS